MKCGIWLAAALAAVMALPAFPASVDVASFVKRDEFDAIKLSPNGDYYAASVPAEDNSILVIVRRADNKPMAGFGLGKNTYIASFEWINPERVVFGTARKFGALDNPQLTGNLYGMNADGSGKDILVGQDVEVMTTGSHIQTKKTEMVAAFLLDPLPDDDRNVLISVSSFGPDAYSRVERPPYSGRAIAGAQLRLHHRWQGRGPFRLR